MKFAPLVATEGGRHKILNSPTTLYRLLDRGYGVLSLTEVRDSLLMWAHYAASHTGFLIAFDSQHPSFKRLNELAPVRYTSKRPILQGSSNVALYMSLWKTLFVKSRDWSYEREWRVVSPLSRCRRLSESCYVKQLDLDCVTGVCLGLACTKSTRRAIVSALKSHSHVVIVQARLDSLGYSLVFDQDLDREPVLVFRPSTAAIDKFSIPFGDGASMELVDGAYVLQSPKMQAGLVPPNPRLRQRARSVPHN